VVQLLLVLLLLVVVLLVLLLLVLLLVVVREVVLAVRILFLGWFNARILGNNFSLYKLPSINSVNLSLLAIETVV